MFNEEVKVSSSERKVRAPLESGRTVGEGPDSPGNRYETDSSNENEQKIVVERLEMIEKESEQSPFKSQENFNRSGLYDINFGHLKLKQEYRTGNNFFLKKDSFEV